MKRVVILDSGPLSLVTHPQGNQTALDCATWLETVAGAGNVIAVPEIADYETRRELLRANRTRSIAKLDALLMRVHYIPITTPIMRRAAALWAQARQQGIQTADDRTLDADMILVAQATLLTHIEHDPVLDYIIATTNVGHIGRFANAQEWQNITPA